MTRRALPLLAVALLAASLLAFAPASASADDGERTYDDGPVMREVGAPVGLAPHEVPVELQIGFFTDCDEAIGLNPPSCGAPAATWVAPQNPVEFCTFQVGRPSSITAGQFRDAVRDAVRAWSDAEAAVGIRYVGDCPTGVRWQQDNNRNEIGFDDGRDAVRGSSVALTLGAWRTLFTNGGSTVLSREFVETDIVISEKLDIPPVCFTSTVIHEMGHAIGFGHSDNPADLMYPSFNPAVLSTCVTIPTDSETALLRTLYGTNRAPTVAAGEDRTVPFAAQLTLSASGTDPEGDALTYTWRQVSGPTVTLTASGASSSASFVAPSRADTLTFEVTASDTYLHTATDTVSITVVEGTPVTASFPVFDSFLPANFAPGIPAGTTALGWTPVTGATSYEFCSALTVQTLATGCATIAGPTVPITWDTVLGPAGEADATRVLSGGWRMTRIRACGIDACSEAVDGPLAGGVRWAAWNIDYDFLAMTFDIAGFQFTFAAVINVSGNARQFELSNGPADDPFARQMGRCSGLAPGGACFAFFDFSAGKQDAYVGIRSSRPGTPTVEHHIRVR